MWGAYRDSQGTQVSATPRRSCSVIQKLASRVLPYTFKFVDIGRDWIMGEEREWIRVAGGRMEGTYDARKETKECGKGRETAASKRGSMASRMRSASSFLWWMGQVWLRRRVEERSQRERATCSRVGVHVRAVQARGGHFVSVWKRAK